MSRPKILITNDDGIHAPGIRHLWNAVKEIADVSIVAPAAEQSAVGVSITLRNPLHVRQVHWPENTPAWCITGTPADCIKMGLKVILDHKPDLIISGINRGTNAGRNVIYSGTVGGTIEGIIQGIPGIAFSCLEYHDTNYQKLEQYIPKLIHYVLKHPLPSGTLLNVNFPDSTHEIKGFKMTRQGKELWMEDPQLRHHPVEENAYYWLGAKLEQFDEHEESDISWLGKGYIAAAPIHIGELTDLAHLSQAKNHFESFLN